jgi:hypothetical protein
MATPRQTWGKGEFDIRYFPALEKCNTFKPLEILGGFHANPESKVWILPVFTSG